jgi:hypothetical protein
VSVNPAGRPGAPETEPGLSGVEAGLMTTSSQRPDGLWLSGRDED